MIDRKQIEEYIDSHVKEMVEDIFALCRINSEKMQAEEENPLGQEQRKLWIQLLRWQRDMDL